MTITREEEVVLLYALYMCGKSPSKARATNFILQKGYLKEREGDEDCVSTGESRIENRIAWTRQNLRQINQLAMPERGTWAITRSGIERLMKAATNALSWDKDSIMDDYDWERFSPNFLEDLRTLGRTIQKNAPN